MPEIKIQISQTAYLYNQETGEVTAVHVHFHGFNQDRTINVNGFIPFALEEFQGNESLAVLSGLVRQQLVAQLSTP